MLLSEGRGAPMIFWFDDYHWADPSTREVVDRIAEQAAERPLLVVIGSRDSEAAEDGPMAKPARIDVSAFSRSETLRLLGERSDAGVIPQGVIELVAERSEGVPLFVQEFLTMAAADADAVASREVPYSLQALVEARIAGDREMRSLTQWSALIGREFEVALLVAATGMDEAAVLSGLEGLVALQVLRPPRGDRRRYEFLHVLVQEAAKASMTEVDRRIRCRRLAETLVERFSSSVEDSPERVARLFEESDEPWRAAEFWRQAGLASEASYSRSESRALYGRALGALRAGDGDDAQLIEEIEALLSRI